MDRSQRRITARYDTDDEAIEDNGEDARDERRLEQLRDVLLRDDGVDHQDDRRRNQQIDDAADSDDRASKGGFITQSFHFRQRGTAECCGGRK